MAISPINIFRYWHNFFFYSLLFFLLLVVYVLSSWWMWFYGGSFSQRVMIDYRVFLAIPLGLLPRKNKYRKGLITTVAILTVVARFKPANTAQATSTAPG